MQLLVLLFCVVVVTADYWEEREKLLRNEDSQYLGHNTKLSPKERLVNVFLTDAKYHDLGEGFLHPESFPPANHFFRAKDKINKYPLFKFIQKMPKGGALHVHDTAMTSLDYVINNITYRDHLWCCQNEDGLQLKFAEPAPAGECWVPLKSLRENASSVEEFDDWLRSKMTLETDNPQEKYSNVNEVWKAFRSIFRIRTPLITYRKAIEDCYYRALQEFREDNVNYVEIRSTLPEVYDLNGSAMNPIQVLGLLKQVSDKFLADYPDFIGIKYIYSPSRNADNATMDEYLANFKKMKQLYPDFLAGFDLVGQEDPGKPLVEFVEKLLNAGPDVKFYFHAGETNWNGMATDLNLVDALLLNTTRIGHGFALLKHPAVMAEAARRGVAVEVCPVSHQVLGLLKDLRNHPASALLAQDFPLVVSSDDPALWGAAPLSHDFYEAFMGIASRYADLRLLKQLALNSFVYSSLKPQEKGDAIRKFQIKWDQFIEDIITNGF